MTNDAELIEQLQFNLRALQEIAQEKPEKITIVSPVHHVPDLEGKVKEGDR